MKIEVKINSDSEKTILIEVEKPLKWSNGESYTLFDYAVIESKKNKTKPFLFTN